MAQNFGRAQAAPPRGPAPARSTPLWPLLAVLAAAMLLWSVANPPMASPDEPAHVVRAAAVVRGDLTGSPDPADADAGVVEVPALYASAMDIPSCFAFQSNVTAACMPAPVADEGTPTEVSTWVVHNNPLPYVLFGLPTLLPDGPWTFAAMRAVGAIACALVLAWGYRSVRELPGGGPVALGVLAATTPMVLFLGSTVNPAGLEISSALALWVSLLTLLRAPDPARLPVRIAGVAVLAALLANSGNASPVFLVAIVAAAVLSSPRRGLSAVLRDRRSWPWLALAVLGLLAAVAWSAAAGRLGAGDTDPADISVLGALRLSVLESPEHVVGMLGTFGWLDTPLPQWLSLLLVVGTGFVVVLALLVAPRRRDALAVLAVGALALALPVALQAWAADDVGIVWQGRYSLPLMVGLPVLAGFVVRAGAAAGPVTWSRPMLVVPVAVLVVGHVAAYAINLHRYVRGTAGPWFEATAADWDPPLPAVVLVAAYAVVLVLHAVLADRLVRRSAPVTASAGDPQPSALAGAGRGL